MDYKVETFVAVDNPILAQTQANSRISALNATYRVQNIAQSQSSIFSPTEKKEKLHFTISVLFRKK